MLKIENLHANVDGKAILKGISLGLNPGEAWRLPTEEKVR